MDQTNPQLTALSEYLAKRRGAILQAWRDAAESDPVQTTVSSLTRAQFNDHIPPLLDAFELKLVARPGGVMAAAADAAKIREDVKHGLQRWQQGYRLGELMHEWGHLHRCLAGEIRRFTAANPEITRDTVGAAHDELISLISHGVNESAVEYGRLQQAEAAGHVRDLQQALSDVSAIEKRRALLIHQSVHDLRGNVQAVSTVADVMLEPEVDRGERIAFAKLIQDGVGSVSTMLTELLSLARLEAGQEQRKLADFDAARALREFCMQTQVLAAERNLFLRTEGPPALMIEGDPGKLRRLVQNLVLNALKYTKEGGVTVSWGEEKEMWWLKVSDTGPGLLAGPGAPIAAGMKAATASARESDEKAAAARGEATSVLPLAPGGAAKAAGWTQQAGEGIGLSIVKRLCEMLDASLELASSAETGTTFRVLFPRRYRAQQTNPSAEVRSQAD